mgnify:CR=1 FL=1
MRKVKSTIHWADVQTAIDAEIRLYGNLFSVPDPDAHDFLEVLNPDSLEVLTGCKVEPCLAQAKPGQSFQFMRQGYFCADSRDSTQEHPVFNGNHKKTKIGPLQPSNTAMGRYVSSKKESMHKTTIYGKLHTSISLRWAEYPETH